jgi:hypothetical protein
MPSPRIIAPLILILSLAYGLSALAAETPPFEFDRVDGDKIYFKGTGDVPKPYRPGWVELSYLGTLSPGPGALPYFLFVGRQCRDCPHDKALVLVRPPVGSAVAHLTSFVYPGKIFDQRSRALGLESRGFFGKCIPGRKDVYVAFQKERVDRRNRLQSSVLVAEADDPHPREQLIERGMPRLETTLRQVRAKACTEIPGRNRIAAPIPLGDHSSKLPPSTDDEDEADDEHPASADAAKEPGPAPSASPAP